VVVILHIVRRADDRYPLAVCAPGDSVLLLGDAVALRAPEGVRSFVSARCAAARGVACLPGEPLSDSEIIALFTRAKRVISW
jgi:hypothetical protein